MSLSDQVRQAGLDGQRDIARFHRDPASLPVLRLARFEDTSLRGVLLRRLLLRAPLPAAWIGALELVAGPHRDDFRGFVISLAYWQGVRRAAGSAVWSRLLHPPVILMYHAIGEKGERPSRHVVPLRRFRSHLRWLRWTRRSVLPLETLVDGRASGHLPPPRSVAITFDDGYADNVQLALPPLHAAGFTATVFMVTGFAGRTNQWDAGGDLAGRPLLSWAELRSSSSRGLSCGGHTHTHPRLPELNDASLFEELKLSSALFERELGPAQRVFAYPHGRFDPRVRTAVETVGFVAACCSLGGTNEPWVPLYELRRVEVKGTDSLATFLLAVFFGMRITPRQLLHKLLRGG